MAQKIKIALVDDHRLFRRGLTLILREFGDFQVVIEAENGVDLIKQLAVKKVDVVLMDLEMPEMNGLETTAKVSDLFPKVKIIGLSIHNQKQFILEMIKNGANGYLSKNVNLDELKKAIHAVVENDFYLNEYITNALLKGWQNQKRVHPVPGRSSKLTAREEEILLFICKEFKTNEIAKKIHLSTRTVENYRHRLLEKTQAKNAAGLVIFAIETGRIKVNLKV